jgi:hypothetical protein
LGTFGRKRLTPKGSASFSSVRHSPLKSLDRWRSEEYTSHQAQHWKKRWCGLCRLDQARPAINAGNRPCMFSIGTQDKKTCAGGGAVGQRFVKEKQLGIAGCG